MELFLFLALANGALSTTVSKSSFFRWFRNYISSKSSIAGELVNCSYCVTHWTSLISVMLWKPAPSYINFWIFDGIMSWLALVAASSLVSGAIWRIFTPPTIRIGD